MTTPNAPFQTQYTDAVAWLEIYDANNDSFLKSLKSQLASKKRLSPKQVTWLLRKFNLVTQNTAPKSPLSDAPNNIADVTLRNAIVYFAMTYNGTFKFMVDMKARLLNNTGLTENQWNAVTKCYTRDAQYKAPLLVTPNIIAPAKYFAFANPVPVVLTRKGAMALKKKYNLNFGPFTVEILGAYDTVSRRGYRNYIMCVNVSGAVNVCRVCGKSLVDHKSVVSGIGPVCAKNLGAIYHTYKTDIQKFMADFATQCAVIGNMEIEFNSWSFKEGYQQMNMAFDAAKQSNNVITPSVAVNAAPPVPAPVSTMVPEIPVLKYNPASKLIRVKDNGVNQHLELHINGEGFRQLLSDSGLILVSKSFKIFNTVTNTSVIFTRDGISNTFKGQNMDKVIIFNITEEI